MSELFHLKTTRIIDSNGIADGATLSFYISGTLTPTPIYTTDDRSTEHPNPLTVAAGAALPNIYLDPDISYRCIVKNSAGTTIDDIDPYLGFSSLGVTFTQSGADAVSRTAQDKLREVVSVKDFGAACDGVTDDTAAARVAIEHCAAAEHPTTLIIPGPTRITGTLNIDRLVDATAGQFVIRGQGEGAGFYVDSALTLFSSSLPYGTFNGDSGPQDAPPSEYVTFRDILFEASDKALAAYVMDSKFLRIRFDQCEFRKIKCLAGADYVQTIYFVGCHVRDWQGAFFTSTDGYDVLVDGGTMFEAGDTGFVFTGAVNRFAWVGGIYEGCTGSALSISGVNGLALLGIYFEGNGAQEIVLGTDGGVSRGVSISGCKFNLPGGRASPYPIDLGISYAVDASGNYSNDRLFDNDQVPAFQIAPCVNYADGGEPFKVDPFRALTATAGGNTQATAAAVTREYTLVTTVTTLGDAMVLPLVADYPGSEPITVGNVGGNNMVLFPGVGQRFLGAAYNDGFVIASGAIQRVYPSASDYWVLA